MSQDLGAMGRSKRLALAFAIAMATAFHPPASAQDLAAGASWIQVVHAKVGRSASRISRQLRDGVYLVHFVIGPDGTASGFAIRGSRPEPAQYALMTGALALTSFPPPPDGQAHAVEAPIRVRSGGRTHRHR